MVRHYLKLPKNISPKKGVPIGRKGGKMLEKEDIEKIIPQRDPFLMIDEV